MNRYLKILGLAIGAMLALGALSAASAAAQLGEITTDGAGQEVTLTGEEINPELNTFHAFGSTVQCDSEYTGHGYTTKAETTHQETTEEAEHSVLVPEGANTVTITPHYTNCDDGSGEGPRQVDMNGCDFVFHIGATTPAGAENTYGVTADVECHGTNTITITGGACTVTVPEQTGLTGAHLANTPASGGTPDDVHLVGTFTNITATACHFLHTTEATLVTDLTIKADDELGEPTGVTISHE